MNKTTRKDGSPTAYGFACGYGMLAESPGSTPVAEDRRVSLFMSHGQFELKSLDWTKAAEAGDWPQQHGWNDPAKFRVWLTPGTLQEARHMFAAECRRLGLKPTYKEQ